MATPQRRVAVVTGSRADYGLLRGLLKILQVTDGIALQVVVCGMHLSEQFGETWRLIEADGFPIAAKIDLDLRGDSNEAVARSAGVGVMGFADALPGLAPDVLVVLGDRFEILSAAVAATLLNIPIAHIHGGEVTAGAFDDAIRHAITKMACVHFTAAATYRTRVIQMGENPQFVFNVGAPGLDQADAAPALDRAALFTALGINGPENFLLVTLHPTTAHPEVDAATVAALLGALSRIEDRSIIFTGVNADPGHGAIDDAIRRFVDFHPGRAWLFASLGSERYWSALRLAEAVVGNSSSGILEAPAVGTPSINIGDRQLGRLRASSIIDCPVDESRILEALHSVRVPPYNATSFTDPPYGRGGASAHIARILCEIDIEAAFPKTFKDA